MVRVAPAKNLFMQKRFLFPGSTAEISSPFLAWCVSLRSWNSARSKGLLADFPLEPWYSDLCWVISATVYIHFIFFYLKVQMALGALPFLWKVLCAWLLSLFIYFLSFAKLLLYSCKGICCISSVVHWLFGMEFDGQVSFTNPLVGLEPSV